MKTRRILYFLIIPLVTISCYPSVNTFKSHRSDFRLISKSIEGLINVDFDNTELSYWIEKLGHKKVIISLQQDLGLKRIKVFRCGAVNFEFKNNSIFGDDITQFVLCDFNTDSLEKRAYYEQFVHCRKTLKFFEDTIAFIEIVDNCSD